MQNCRKSRNTVAYLKIVTFSKIGFLLKNKKYYASVTTAISFGFTGQLSPYFYQLVVMQATKSKLRT